MKKGFIIGLSITLTIVALMAAYALHIKHQLDWDVREPMTSEQQVKLSSMGLIPYVADSLERYADRGVRDTEYMAESYAYNSAEELAESIPGIAFENVEEALKTEGEQAKDIKGVSVTRYGLSGMRQATEDELDPKYEYYFYGVFIYYYVLEYEDGTYRFAVDIHNT